jgi:hypothetical protein
MAGMRHMRLVAVGFTAALITTGTALAVPNAKLLVKGPGAVSFGSTYKVTVTGTTGNTPANSVMAFEGGYTSGKPLHCYESARSERDQYPQIELHPVAVHGSFKHTYVFRASHSGGKALCAYLVHEPIPTTGPYSSYAHASAVWTVS